MQVVLNVLVSNKADKSNQVLSALLQCHGFLNQVGHVSQWRRTLFKREKKFP